MIRKAATRTVAQRGQNQEYIFPVTIAFVGSLDKDKRRVRCKSWHFRGQQIPMTSSWGPNFAELLFMAVQMGQDERRWIRVN
jgi:hypothetical protein